MRTRFVEATQGVEGGFNHGKFMVALFDQLEWSRPSAMDLATDGLRRPLVERCGWTRSHVMVVDLQTGEGAIFKLGGLPSADLDKHRVWVCPMFEPFLTWLYDYQRKHVETQADGARAGWFEAMPALVELDAEPAIRGHRRQGPSLIASEDIREGDTVLVDCDMRLVRRAQS